MQPALRMSSIQEKPRITHRGIKALGDKVDRGDWRILACRLDQRLFTDDWIQVTESRCLPTGKSPTAMVLREWQQGFSIDQCVPVQYLCEILHSIGRTDAASVVAEMHRVGTFLDFLEESQRNRPHPSHPSQSPDTNQPGQIHCGSRSPSQWSPSVRPKQTLPNGNLVNHGASWNFVDNSSDETYHPSPQEASYAWTDRCSSANSATTCPRCTCPHCTQSARQNLTRHVNETPRSRPLEQPQNLTKSKYSLVDGTHSSNPNPHRPKEPDQGSAFKTWPPRGSNKGSRQSVSPDCHFTPIQGEMSHPWIGMEGPGFPGLCTSILPLRSVSPENASAATGASPVPVVDPNRNICWFITYAYPSYQAALNLGITLKAQGHEVMVDRKMSSFTSLAECQQETTRLFNASTHIVVIYNNNYIEEVRGAKSPLNTWFIYDLMLEEFRRLHEQNIRFVPIIDYDNIDCNSIPPLLRRYPTQYAEFVCRALRSFNASKKTPTKEVSIERTVYSSCRH